MHNRTACCTQDHHEGGWVRCGTRCVISPHRGAHLVKGRAAPAHRTATARARPRQAAAPRDRRPAGLAAGPCPRHTQRGLCGCTGPAGGGGGLRPTPPAGVGANGPGDPGVRAPMAGTLERAPPAHRQDAPGVAMAATGRPTPAPSPLRPFQRPKKRPLSRRPVLPFCTYCTYTPHPPAGGPARSASHVAGNGHGAYLPYSRPRGVAVRSRRRRLQGRARHGGKPPPVGRRRRPRPGARQFSFHCRPPVALLS